MNSSSLVNYFISQGVPYDTVLLLLMLPLIITLIAFLRQVVGIRAFGIYTPSIVMFAFWAIGIKYGIAIFVSVIFFGTLARFLLKRLRILYLPRVAITLSVVALSILAILVIGGYFRRKGLATVSIFPLLIMVTIVEKFVATQIEKDGKTAFFLAMETLVISVGGYFILRWELLIHFIAAYPWIILFTFPINIILGKWTNFRLTEYLRFREITKYIS